MYMYALQIQNTSESDLCRMKQLKQLQRKPRKKKLCGFKGIQTPEISIYLRSEETFLTLFKTAVNFTDSVSLCQMNIFPEFNAPARY